MKGLYVHIPFCIKKCKYCDFNSFSFKKDDKKRYLNALYKQMENYRGEKLDTVFVGGGTPTCLENGEIEKLLKKINDVFSLSEDCEFTMEANPGTVDSKKLEIMLTGGVNRLSVGVQSFNDGELAAIGRIHSADEAERTISAAKACGFKNISIDLMSALPGQTSESFEKSLKKAIDLNPQHISCYSLILEDGTPLYKEYIENKLILPDEDTERYMYSRACEILEQNGYYRYEISNFAKNGKRSRHNLKYWNCDEYIGIGLSAHSYLDGKRFSNTNDFEQYNSGEFFSGEEEILSKEDKISEFMFMGLRKTEGVSKTEFLNRFSIAMEDVFAKPILKFVKMGMLIDENDFIRLSDDAVSVSNRIMCEFIL